MACDEVLRMTGSRIRAIMAAEKVSVTELARRMGIKQPTLSEMLRADMQQSTLKKIASALSVPVSRLMEDDEPDDRSAPAHIVAGNIGDILKARGMRSSDLAKLLDLTPAQLAKRLADPMDGKHLGEIAAVLETSVTRLTMPPDRPRPKVPNSTPVNLVPHTATIPVWLSINAGNGEDSNDFTGQRDGEILVPEAYIQRKVFALRVAGDSMEPELREGDIALFEPLAAGARPSAKQIYAVEVQGWAEMVVKRVKTEHNQVILVSTNPLVKPVYLDPSLTTIRLRGELLQSTTMWKTTAHPSA